MFIDFVVSCICFLIKRYLSKAIIKLYKEFVNEKTSCKKEVKKWLYIESSISLFMILEPLQSAFVRQVFYFEILKNRIEAVAIGTGCH